MVMFIYNLEKLDSYIFRLLGKVAFSLIQLPLILKGL